MPPSVIAHRGVWGAGVPENSLAAFEQAIDLGADMIEFDVRRTRDGELILFHDREIAGLAVASLSRSEITDRAGLLPPLLDEALELARGRIALDVELKEDGYVDEVAVRLSAFAALLCVRERVACGCEPCAIVRERGNTGTTAARLCTRRAPHEWKNRQ